MKLTVFAVCAAVLLFAATGCGSDNPSGPGEDGPLKANINNQLFVAQTATVNRGGGSITINASGGEARAITIIFPDLGPGTYSVGPGVFVSVNVTVGSEQYFASQEVGGGQITVTSISQNNIVGNFGFLVVGSSNIPVSQGEFNINF